MHAALRPRNQRRRLDRGGAERDAPPTPPDRRRAGSIKIRRRTANRAAERQGLRSDAGDDANKLIHLSVGVGARDDRQDRVEQRRRQIGQLPLRATIVRDRARNLQLCRWHATTCLPWIYTSEPTGTAIRRSRMRELNSHRAVSGSGNS